MIDYLMLLAFVGFKNLAFTAHAHPSLKSFNFYSVYLISGQCSHFLPTENTIKHLETFGFLVFSGGYEMGTLSTNGLMIKKFRRI